jgi:hypothetical protein
MEVEVCCHKSIILGLDGGKCLHSPAALSPGEERAIVTGRKHFWAKDVFWM